MTIVSPRARLGGFFGPPWPSSPLVVLQKHWFSLCISTICQFGIQKTLVFLMYFNYLSISGLLTKQILQHVSNANPHGTDRFQGSTLLN